MREGHVVAAVQVVVAEHLHTQVCAAWDNGRRSKETTRQPAVGRSVATWQVPGLCALLRDGPPIGSGTDHEI